MQNILFVLKKYTKDMIIIAFIILCLALSIYSIYQSQNEDDTTIPTDLMAGDDIEEDLVTEEPLIYHVDIKGAVENPGVYEVEDGAIINDVIALAGGLSEDAYQDGINLSKKIVDEMVIYIYTEDEVTENAVISTPNMSTDTFNSESNCQSNNYDITDCVTMTESVIIPGTGSTNNEISTTEEESKIININTASKEELVTLSGIGETRAEAIIEYRKTNGQFTSIEDIMNVSGIGDAIFTKIKDFITV